MPPPRPPSGPPPGPPPPPANKANKTPELSGKETKGRTNLLTDIHKGAKLRKTVTVDKSAPVVGSSKSHSGEKQEMSAVMDFHVTNPAKFGSVFSEISGRNPEGDLLNGVGATGTTTTNTPSQEEEPLNEIGYDSIGGVRSQILDDLHLKAKLLRHLNLFKAMRQKKPSRNIFLHGPRGVGKCLIGIAVANEAHVSIVRISGPEIMSKLPADAELKLQEAFKKAEQNAPAIVFIDEVERIAPDEDMTDGEKRILATMLTSIEKQSSQVIVMAASNQPINSVLCKVGRFDQVDIGIPDATGRHEILRIHTRNRVLSDDVDLQQVANETHGFVGADLAALCAEATVSNTVPVKMEDFRIALSKIKRKIKRL